MLTKGYSTVLVTATLSLPCLDADGYKQPSQQDENRGEARDHGARPGEPGKLPHHHQRRLTDHKAPAGQ